MSALPDDLTGPTEPRPSRAYAALDAARPDLTEPLGIVELVRVAEIPHKRGRIMVAVTDAGNGPAIDARYWLDPRAGYVPRSVKKQARPAMPQTPTREGFWLSPVQAEALIEALSQAVVVAQDDEL